VEVIKEEETIQEEEAVDTIKRKEEDLPQKEETIIRVEIKTCYKTPYKKKSRSMSDFLQQIIIP